MWPSLVKIRYTELKLLCGRPPAIPNHIIRPVSRRVYKNAEGIGASEHISTVKTCLDQSSLEATFEFETDRCSVYTG
jgi:hypothetical protein